MKKLSTYLEELVILTNQDIQGAILELACRLESIEQERREDLNEMLDTLCTCSVRRESNHLPVCPQSRKDQ